MSLSKADFDARFHRAAMRVGGISDARIASYTPPPSEAVPAPAAVEVRVHVNRTAMAQGEFRQQSLARVEVTYLRADVAPLGGGRVVIDGETWENVDERDTSDDSLSVWAVRRV